MKTKKHIAGVLAFLLLMTVGFTACNNDTPPADGDDTQIEDNVDGDNDGGEVEDEVQDEDEGLEDSVEDQDQDSEDADE